MEQIQTVTRFASDALLRIAAVGLVLMTIIVSWQVFGRNVLGSSPSWSEEASLTLMIWYVALAAAAGVREGFHISIVAVQDVAPPRVRVLMRIASSLVVGLCGAGMAIWGGELVARTWGHAIPALGLPRGLAYLGVPIAGLLIVLFSFERTLEEIRALQARGAEDGPWSC